MKKRINILLGFSLLLFVLQGKDVLAAMPGEQLHYVALGDSLAAGTTPFGKLGESYADMIADKLKRKDTLASFTKEFAVPGYTTGDVLADLQGNMKRGHSTIRDTIRRADIITISAGANDMLHSVKVNKASHELDFDEKDVARAFDEAGHNLVQIQQLIGELNPEAQIFVMGYYNPFPYLPDDAQRDIGKLLDRLNGEIEKSTVKCGSTFVPTRGAVRGNYALYIPNPRNIHLSLPGYARVAEQFWKKMQPSLLLSRYNDAGRHYDARQYPDLPVLQRASFEGRPVLKQRLIGG